MTKRGPRKFHGLRKISRRATFLSVVQQCVVANRPRIVSLMLKTSALFQRLHKPEVPHAVV